MFDKLQKVSSYEGILEIASKFGSAMKPAAEKLVQNLKDQKSIIRLVASLQANTPVWVDRGLESLESTVSKAAAKGSSAGKLLGNAVEKGKHIVDNAKSIGSTIISSNKAGRAVKSFAKNVDNFENGLSPVARTVVKDTKGSIFTSVVGGALDGIATYTSRVEQYGKDAARQDATAHFAISTGSSIAGAAAGAAIGSIIPGAGTAVGAACGFLIGTASSAIGEAVYDNHVNRGEGDGVWEKFKNNMKFW